MKFKNLEKFKTGGGGSKMQLGVPFPKTPKERVYRFSPNEQAHPRHFVIGNPHDGFVPPEGTAERMKLQPRSKQTVCPYSGVIADDGDFTHPDDVKAAVEMVKDAAQRDIEEALSQMFKGIGQRSRGAIKVKSSPRRYRPKPRFGRKDLMRELVCDHCSRDYGVFAIGLFCPDCGAPNLRLHFAREVELVGAQVDLADALDEGAEELAYRLLGNAHEDVLTAFEATLKAVYLYGMGQRGPDAAPFKPVKNDFQNIDNATKRFAELGFDPFGVLSDPERAVLALNIQKRHIIGHNLGVVDERFATHAADARIGETVHLVGEDIRQFAAVGQEVVDQLDSWLVGAPSPTIGAAPEISAPAQMLELTMDDRLAALDLDLSPLARKFGSWVATRCQDGMCEHVDEEEVIAAFEGTDYRDLAEAMAELEADGFGSVSRFSGRRLPLFRPGNDLYVTFDPIALGHEPMDDALLITEKVLAGDDSVNVAQLHSELDWPRRRFNPAVAIVVSQIDDRRISKTLSGEYPTRSFHLLAEDRVALKRFIKRIKG